MTDSRIVDMFIDRNEDAILYSKELYDNRLLRISKNILADLCDTEEALNDTYLSAWNSIPPNEPRTYLFAFLARITRCISFDICKKKCRDKRSAIIVELSNEMEECIPSPDDSECNMDCNEFGEIITSFLITQPDKTRNIFLQRYWYMDTIREISKASSLSESNVKVILYRTRTKLKDYLLKGGYKL